MSDMDFVEIPAVKTASSIPIEDVGGYFSSQSVEGALQEIGNGTVSGTAWGSITGTLSNQTDLQAALDLKYNAINLTEDAQDAVGSEVGHGLDYNDVTGSISVDESELLHNSLGGLNVGDYLHLTAAEYAAMVDGSGVATRVAIWSDVDTLTYSERFRWEGTDNMVVGDQAGISRTTFNYATLMGAYAGNALTSGNQDTFIGKDSGIDVETGESNTAVGMQSLYSDISGSYNAAFGVHSLLNNLTSNNSGFGTQTLMATTTGYGNSALGRDAGWVNVTGHDNFFGGYQAGINVTDADDSIFLGYQAGFAGVTQYDKVVAIGYKAIAGASSVMILGGSGADEINIGLSGVTAPNEKLTLATGDKIGWEVSSGVVDTTLERISADVLGTEDSFRFGANLYSDDSLFYYSDSTKYLGLGIAGAFSRLSVYGESAQNDMHVGIFGNSSTLSPLMSFLRSRAGVTALQANDVIGRLVWDGYDGSDFNDLNAYIQGVANQNFTTSNQGTRMEFYTVPDNSTTAALRMTISNDGQVGINATPGYRLHVAETQSSGNSLLYGTYLSLYLNPSSAMSGLKIAHVTEAVLDGTGDHTGDVAAAYFIATKTNSGEANNLYGQILRVDNTGSGDVANSWGTFSEVYHSSSVSTISNAVGFFGRVANVNTSNITTAYGSRFGVINISDGVITNAIGASFEITRSAGTITNATAALIDDLPAFSDNNQKRVALQIEPIPDIGAYTGTTVGGIWFNSDSGASRDGVVWGTTLDTNLYRSAANVLKTDDDFIAGGATANVLTLGSGSAGVDYAVTFNGETNDGVFKWMEDEDYFQFDDDIYPQQRLLLPMGEISYFDITGTAVVITTQSDGSTNMVKAAPATALSSGGMEFDNGGANNGRLRYTGTATKMFHVACTISVAPAGANDTFVFGVAKGGTVIATSKVLLQAINASQPRSTALHVMIELATNEYLELFVGNTTDADDCTVHSLNLFAMGM